MELTHSAMGPLMELTHSAMGSLMELTHPAMGLRERRPRAPLTSVGYALRLSFATRPTRSAHCARSLPRAQVGDYVLSPSIWCALGAISAEPKP